MDFPNGDFELDPPQTEIDSFILEAIMQLGATPHPDEDDVYIVPGKSIIELARRVSYAPSTGLPQSNLAV